jgi:Tfp pilus assembly protein PilN
LTRINLNLATFEYQDTRVAYTMMAVLTALVLAVSSFNISLFVGYQNRIYEFKERIVQLDHGNGNNKVKREESPPAVTKEDAASIRSRADFVNRLILMDIYPWDELLDELEKSTPSNVTILSFVSMKEENRIKVEGKAASIADVGQFLKVLEGSSLYRNNVLSSVNVGKNGAEPDRPAREFPVRFEIISTVDAGRLFND